MPCNGPKPPHLVVAAFWTTEDYDASTEHVGAALEEIAIKGSGACVSVKAPDAALRFWLRAVQIEEAADWTPALPGQGPSV